MPVEGYYIGLAAAATLLYLFGGWARRAILDRREGWDRRGWQPDITAPLPAVAPTQRPLRLGRRRDAPTFVGPVLRAPSPDDLFRADPLGARSLPAQLDAALLADELTVDLIGAGVLSGVGVDVAAEWRAWDLRWREARV